MDHPGYGHLTAARAPDIFKNHNTLSSIKGEDYGQCDGLHDEWTSHLRLAMGTPTVTGKAPENFSEPG